MAGLRLRPGDELVLVDNTLAGVAVGEAAGTEVRVVAAGLERSSYHARNVGAEAASCEWLLFMDADCLPAPDLLDVYFGKPFPDRCGVIAGGVRPAAGQTGRVARHPPARTHIRELAQRLPEF